jgi:hypothetical protein
MKIALNVLAVSFLSGALVLHAGALTYNWTGDSGVSGYFNLDSSVFTNPSTFEAIPESSLTGFNFTNGIYTFDFAHINPGSVIWFDSTASPPKYLDGGGYAATDSLGNRLSFNGSQLYLFPVGGGQILFTTGNFVPTASAVPEPATLSLLGFGLLGFGLAVHFRRIGFRRLA